MRKGAIWFLPLLLACATEVAPEGGKGDEAPQAPVMHAWSDESSDGRGPCDRDQKAVINGREVALPVLCNPKADPLWDPPPDAVRVPEVTLPVNRRP